MLDFIREYRNLNEVLIDQKLAKLGDAYVNFLYSLVLSKRNREPTGIKVKGQVLSNAFRIAGLREYLPSRIDRHKQADAAEALIVYSWIKNLITLKKGFEILLNNNDEVDAFSNILIEAKTKFKT